MADAAEKVDLIKIYGGGPMEHNCPPAKTTSENQAAKMPVKSRLKSALNRESRVDFQKLHQKKVAKARTKAPQLSKAKSNGKRKSLPTDDEWEAVDDSDVEGGAPVSGEDEDSEEEEAYKLDLEALDESSSSEDVDMEERIERKPKASFKAIKAAASEDEEEDDEEDIAMSDLESLPDDEKEDLIPHSRLSINNTAALTASLNRISIPTDKSVPFATHQTITSIEPTEDNIEDIQDDLKRELAFYAQSLEAAKRARALLKSEGVPFSRPKDYFAEMVKDDGHMELVKARLVEEASAKKASSEARKLRDLKKFGKQVQVAKLQERQKDKRDTLDKIKSLKRSTSLHSSFSLYTY